MTNFEKIKSLSEEDFADYIYSVYLAGKMSLRYTAEDVDYKEWLNEEYKKPTHNKEK